MANVTWQELAVRQIDVDHYRQLGLLPASSSDLDELAELIATHADLVNRYDEAQANRDEAEARHRNAEADDRRAIETAIQDNTDIPEPTVAATLAAWEHARQVVGGFRRPLLQASSNLSWATVRLDKEALDLLHEQIAEREQRADAARAALRAAEAEVAEAAHLMRYLTDMDPNDTFPSTRLLVTVE